MPYGARSPRLNYRNRHQVTHAFAAIFFNLVQTLPDELVRNEAAWKVWYSENEPEEVPVPSFEGRLAVDPSVGAFFRLLLVRCEL